MNFIMVDYQRGIRMVMAVSTFLSACGAFFVPNQPLAADFAKTLLVLPNVDDDDLDGKPDCDDGTVNGPFDMEDLTRLRVPFRVIRDDIEISGAGRSLFNVVAVEPTKSGGSIICIEARGPRSKTSSATITAKAGRRERSFVVDVRPFLLTSSLQRAKTVFVVEFPSSRTLVSALKSIFNDVENGPALSIVPGSRVGTDDVWIQDATEIGAFSNSDMNAAMPVTVHDPG